MSQKKLNILIGTAALSIASIIGIHIFKPNSATFNSESILVFFYTILALSLYMLFVRFLKLDHIYNRNSLHGVYKTEYNRIDLAVEHATLTRYCKKIIRRDVYKLLLNEQKEKTSEQVMTNQSKIMVESLIEIYSDPHHVRTIRMMRVGVLAPIFILLLAFSNMNQDEVATLFEAQATAFELLFFLILMIGLFNTSIFDGVANQTFEHTSSIQRPKRKKLFFFSLYFILRLSQDVIPKILNYFRNQHYNIAIVEQFVHGRLQIVPNYYILSLYICMAICSFLALRTLRSRNLIASCG